ncbi:MAG: class I SAM-dependent methyltransferase [Actinobacteria bacterium]|nr:class I SAM-dependent methyltransferase [Actinomycetota bacterium]
MDTTWQGHAKVEEYLERIGRLPARITGEAELLDALPAEVHRVLDLGCGDGRLAALVMDAHPEVEAAVALDRSPAMLGAAHTRFAGDPRVTVAAHDMADPLVVDESFDAVVSGFAIHHLAHDRKRTLFDEIHAALRPGGVFANLEVVECATPALQAEFFARIGRAEGDPEDVCAPVEPQLEWMRAAGFTDVDCQWRWRGFALLVGRK